MKITIFLLYILTLSFLFFGCSDNFNFTFINESGYNTMIEADAFNYVAEIKNNETVTYKKKQCPRYFILSISNKNYEKKYHFSDNDHWFGGTHNVTVNILPEGASFSGEAGYLFDEERY